MQSLLLDVARRAELKSMMEQDDRLRVNFLGPLASNLDLLLRQARRAGARRRRGAARPRGRAGPDRAIGDGPASPMTFRTSRPRRSRRDRGSRRRPRPPRRRGPARPRCARRPRAAARGGRLPHPRRGAARARPAWQPAHRCRRSSTTCSPDSSAVGGHRIRAFRPRRRARGDLEAVRVRRPVPPRPSLDADQRAGPPRERAARRSRGELSTSIRLAPQLRGVPDRPPRPRPCCSWI